ncbi:hypothetical protein BLA29_011731, partial [Euroglyphus maynei]
MYRKICRGNYNDIDKHIKKLEQKRLNELQTSMNDKFKMMVKIQKQIELLKMNSQKSDKPYVVPEINNNNRLTTTIEEVVPEIQNDNENTLIDNDEIINGFDIENDTNENDENPLKPSNDEEIIQPMEDEMIDSI